MAGPKPAALPLGDCPTQDNGGEGGIRTLGRLLTYIRLAGAHLQPARSPLLAFLYFLTSMIWRRMRDSNPHGQNPAVFKTAALPIRTNPPSSLILKIGRGNFVKLILCKTVEVYIRQRSGRAISTFFVDTLGTIKQMGYIGGKV